MDASVIFDEMISSRLRPLVLQYDAYTDHYKVHPYHHVNSEDFEKNFSELLFDGIVFYAYEKDEIERDYKRGRMDDLHKASRIAYENRVQKTEKTTDGLLGEIALDCFIKCFFSSIELLYSRVKMVERYPHKEDIVERKGHEIHGYDGILFSNEDGQKYMWVGQVKTGTWQYCFDGIKEDINKSILKNYFSDAMAIMSDIMRAANSSSQELMQIIDDINDIVCDTVMDRTARNTKIVEYIQKRKIIVRLPCMIIAEENKYDDQEDLLRRIKMQCSKAFCDFVPENEDKLPIEILLMIFPVRNLKSLREEFLAERRPQ